MITIGIFAYNEERNLRSTVETVMTAAAKAGPMPLEIIIVNDGSTDHTEQVIADLKKEHPAIRSITHERNTGIGTAIKDIVKASTCDKICFMPGDNIFTLYSVKAILANANKADIILHYHINSEIRKRGRIFLSVLFTFIYKFTFNLQLIYVNCLGIYPTRALKAIAIRSKRYNIAAELNVKTLLQGYSYYEIGSYMNPLAQKSSALTASNFFDVAISFLKLCYEVKVTHRDAYSKQPVRVIDSI